MKNTILAITIAIALAAVSIWVASPSTVAAIDDATNMLQAGQPCSAAVHAAITTAGPDGQQYPTWHPPVDPASGCYFGHEHGADPRTSQANASMPPFGYIAAAIGHAPEPHVGFKVFVMHYGAQSAGVGTAQGDMRIVFHMGTAGVGRYTEQFHSMIYDFVARDGTGRSAHIQGLANTGPNAGSPCDHPRLGNRDFSQIGCADPYEHWSYQLRIKHPADPPYESGVDQVRFSGTGAVAAFDPITTRDPADNSRLVYTEHYRHGAQFDPFLPTAWYRGCKRQMYVIPFWWNSASRPGSSTVYWTDGNGLINPAGQGPGLLRQEISQSPRSNVPVFLGVQSYCDPTVRAPN